MKNSFKMVVFYDNWCPLCKQVKKNIERLDWFHLIKMVGFRGQEKELGIPENILENEMHAIILRNDKIVKGFEAFVAISWRIPLFIFFWPVLVFFKMIGVGSKLYDIIARNRMIIPTGHCNGNKSCNIKK